MGSSVTLYVTDHDSFERFKSHDNESKWSIRDRCCRASPRLWIACFQKEDINLKIEIDEDDGRSFDDANFFTTISLAISNLSNRSGRMQRIFSRNDEINRCIGDLINRTLRMSKSNRKAKS